MAVDLGKIGQTLKGGYNSSLVYEKLDVVTDNGSSYVSKINGNNLPLSDASAWQINSLKGSDGAPGQDGQPGEPGPQGQQGLLGPIGPKGEDGVDGVDGTNAQSFINKGNITNYAGLPPTGNVVNDAYYNEADGRWYIYNGTSFQIDGHGVLITIPLASEFDETDAVKAQGGKQIYDWLYGNDTNVELGATSALTRADMTTNEGANTTITYWMKNYTVPYPKSILSEFKINVSVLGDVYIKRYKMAGSGPSATLTFMEQKVYTVAAGINTINILTTPDKSGNINNLWKWEPDDKIALFSSAGLLFSQGSSPFNGLWGHGSSPGNDTGNFTISSLTDAPTYGLLLSLKFTELVSSPIAGKVVGVINESTAADSTNFPNVEAVMNYAASSKLKNLTQIILVPSFGQSLAGGTDGGASTFSAPVDIAYTTGNFNSNVQDMNGGFVETFKEMAKHNDFDLPEGFKFMTSVAYLGGTCITDLSKGTATYNSLIAQVQTAKNTANGLGKTFSVPAFCWTQGEEDYRAGGSNGVNYNTGKYVPTEYATKLIQLVNDLNIDIKSITGQQQDVLCIMYQVASHIPYGRYPRIALEQLKAATLDKRIVLAKTMYDVEYNVADNVHAPNKTYRNIGNHYGIGLFDAIVKKEHSLPVYPIKWTVMGNSVYIQFHVPVKPLVFDDVWVSPQTDGNKGFNLLTVNNELSTSATVSLAAFTITNVELVSADTVKITMSGTPSAGTRLTYGVNGLGWEIVNGNTTNGVPRRSGRTEGARGNLRDSQTYFNPVSNYFNLYNWATIFEIVL